jgi:hypothetical protein
MLFIPCKRWWLPLRLEGAVRGLSLNEYFLKKSQVKKPVKAR